MKRIIKIDLRPYKAVLNITPINEREQIFCAILNEFAEQLHTQIISGDMRMQSNLHKLNEAFKALAGLYCVDETDTEYTFVNGDLFANYIFAISCATPAQAAEFARRFRLPYDKDVAAAAIQSLKNMGLLETDAAFIGVKNV
jgi:hypothetical protein